jgi:hypothetical protein
MAIFRVGFFPDFKWDDVVLVGADRDGMRLFQSAVRSAHKDGEGAFGSRPRPRYSSTQAIAAVAPDGTGRHRACIRHEGQI